MATAYTGADLLTDALEAYGVTRVFGNPGTTELPVIRALEDSDLEYVLALHEDIAVGMAAGYARTRRQHAQRDPSIQSLGVANLHIAPGLAHGLGNLYDAKQSGTPLLVTTGNHGTDFRHEEPLLSGDLVSIADPFVKWSTEVLTVEALPRVLHRAVRTALTPPTGPVFLSLPLDVTMAETDADPERLGPIPDAGAGDPDALDRAADLLTEAEEVVLIAGDGIAKAGAIDDAVAFAEASGARVHGEILAGEVNFPMNHEQWVSAMAPDEGLARRFMDADTIVFAGCSTHTTITKYEQALLDRETTCVHLGADADELGKRYPTDAVVLGDEGRLLSGLATRVDDGLDGAVREGRLDRVRETRTSVTESMAQSFGGDPEDPRLSKAELAETVYEAAPDALVVDESITARYPLLARWPLGPEQFLCHKGGGLGYGLPAALGAAVAEAQSPGESRTVIGYIGDGSYLYYPHSLYTAARYDLDLTVVVVDNRNYRILKNNARDLFGDEDYGLVGMDFDPPVDIPLNARSHGARSHSIEDPEDLAPTLREAIETTGPDVLDVPIHD